MKIILFIYGLFNNAVNNSDYVTSNVRAVSEEWIWNYEERSPSRSLIYDIVLLPVAWSDWEKSRKP
jgi:hypothetical protein